ncbi:uncharacterized protein LOC141697113 isoform X2 [Apium graveolens]|uniref:uncharacterized protein LOC141697113 isoform X2 n=1 Tax=Apium graveolens TaxID=4045 RepID=UPI003D7BDD36
MPLLLFVALVGATAGGTIEAPHPLLSFDYEVELAIVIGLNAHDVCEPTIVLENLEETREEVFLAGTIEVQKCFRSYQVRRYFHELKRGAISLQSYTREVLS